MKFSYDTMSAREQRLVKFGGIAAAAILIFGVMIPLDSSVARLVRVSARSRQTLSGCAGWSGARGKRAGASGRFRRVPDRDC